MNEDIKPGDMPGTKQIDALAKEFFTHAGEHCDSMLILMSVCDRDRRITWTAVRSSGNDHAMFGLAKEWAIREEERYRADERAKLQ